MSKRGLQIHALFLIVAFDARAQGGSHHAPTSRPSPVCVWCVVTVRFKTPTGHNYCICRQPSGVVACWLCCCPLAQAFREELWVVCCVGRMISGLIHSKPSMCPMVALSFQVILHVSGPAIGLCQFNIANHGLFTGLSYQLPQSVSFPWHLIFSASVFVAVKLQLLMRNSLRPNRHSG